MPPKCGDSARASGPVAPASGPDDGISAQCIHGGSFLMRSAELICSKLLDMNPTCVLAPALVITFGTVCSGGEVILLALLAMQETYRGRGINIKFRHLFSCERKPNIQEWIKGVTTLIQFDDSQCQPCLFDNIETLGGSRARCIIHDKPDGCEVPSVDLLIGGTSCKDFSKASKSAKPTAEDLRTAGGSSPGGSVNTFLGLISYLLSHLVSILVFENVDTLDDGDATDACHSNTATTCLDAVCEQFERGGLTCQAVLTDSMLFGHSCDRRRFYITGVQTGASRLFNFAEKTIKATFTDMLAHMEACQRPGPSVNELLLPDSDTAVQSELNRRIASGYRLSHYNVSASITAFASRGLRWGADVFKASIKASPWFDTLPQNQRNILAVSYADNDTAGLRDISQSTSRIRYSRCTDVHHTTAMCMMPGQVVWVDPDLMPCNRVAVPRLMLGRESLMLQGYPLIQIQKLVACTSELVMTQIAGNMMSSAVPLALLMSLFASLPWSSNADKVLDTCNADEVEAALSLVRGISVNDEQKQDGEPARKTRRILRRRS